MPFLATNERLLSSIDAACVEIKRLVNEHGAHVPMLRDGWFVHFRRVWRELRRQQNWHVPPNTEGHWLGWRVAAHLLARAAERFTRNRFTSLSPLFDDAANSVRCFPPHLASYQTAYGFALCSSTLDMWQLLATGHFANEFSETVVLLRLLPHVSQFVDVGANIGFYTLLAAHESGGALRVLACEPAPDNCMALRAALATNGLEAQVVLEQTAVGERDGEADLFLCPLGNGGHSLTPNWPLHVGRGHERVPVRSLDSLVAEHGSPDERAFLKIDVEGAESRVLQGATAWLRSPNAPIVMFEAWPASPDFPRRNHVEVAAQLRAAGYKVFVIRPARHGQTPLRPFPPAGDFAPTPNADYLALPAWALQHEQAVAAPLDMRIFSPTARLRAMERFVRDSLAELNQICGDGPGK